MQDFFVCPRCGNKDLNFIGKNKQGKPYCKACISFNGDSVKDKASPVKDFNYYIDYSLSIQQKEISSKLVYNIEHKRNSLVCAVTGAGKTEIVFEPIKLTLKNGGIVGFVIPRKDVVIELADRLKQVFKYARITSVFGGNTGVLQGNIIVLTCHQLYRYERYFDLLILDEMDAFPYKGDTVLEKMFYRALNGNYIQMSATPTDEYLAYFKKRLGDVFYLNTRFHKHPLPVPQFKVGFVLINYLKLFRKLQNYKIDEKQCFIFSPTIAKCEFLYHVIHLFFKNGSYVHSKVLDRQKRIQDFRDKKYSYLVTTAVLERGVTVEGLQVMIFDADHPLYDEYILVQISGRAGRKKLAPTGDVIFYAKKITKSMEKAKTNICNKNAYL